jgi:hypothetical protein
MSDEIRDPFAGGESGPYVKFENVGDSVSGVITDIKLQNDVYNGEVRRFDDGTPKPVVVVHLKLDDGEETRDFVKGRSVSQLREAVHAVEGLGMGPKKGARFSRQFVGVNSANKEKLYEVKYSRDVSKTDGEGDAGSERSFV